jgi:hypothetical protein
MLKKVEQEGKKLVIFGASYYGSSILKCYKDIKWECFLDNNVKYSKYVIYIDPENTDFVESLTVKERKNLINRILREQDDIAITKRRLNMFQTVVKHVIISTHIGEIVFDIRKEKSPCSLCARMRRGALNNFAADNNFTKLALGHNLDDAVETFLMNLLTEGRIGCFSPVTLLEDKAISIIRPLVLAPEKDIRKAANKLDLPVFKLNCKVDGTTNRQRTKELTAMLDKMNHGSKMRIFGAMQRDLDDWKI